MIVETISPFFKKVGNVFPCKDGATAGDFFEGKYNGQWKVKVNPRADRQVPNFIVIGPTSRVMVKAKYVRNEFERKQMCSDCFSICILDYTRIVKGLRIGRNIVKSLVIIGKCADWIQKSLRIN